MGEANGAAKPFLKWAGGKQQLLPDLLRRVEAAGGFAAYHEPFLGGGALFFALAKMDLLSREVYLSDGNPNLIEAVLGVRNHLDDVIALLHRHRERHSEEYFYAIRKTTFDTVPERAARIIYLNRTCFNGLYRENSRGEFNVPFGKYKKPCICDELNLWKCSNQLRKAQVETRPFETVLEKAQSGDFVYFDPPYHPLSKTASFTKYARDDFNAEAQKRLAEVFGELHRRGVKVLLSNSDTEFIRDLYSDHLIETVQARRSVNSNGNRRGRINELLIRSF